jgi:hypothetical protein
MAYHRGIDDPNWRWFWILGRLFGVLSAIVMFTFGWFTAVASWGWLLGLAFGWLPAAIVAAMAGLLAWFLWAPLVLVCCVGALAWGVASTRSV